mgnify:CR=1 FL=1
MAKGRTRVIIADDHKIMREGLRSLLEEADDIDIVAEAEDGRTAVEAAKEFRPHLVVMDVGMPDLNGIEATRKILDEIPNVKIIALSMHSDRQYVGGMLEAGAAGYLLKDCAFDELQQAVRTVLADQTYLSPDITDVVVKNFVRGMPTKAPSVYAQLTPREREVLQLVAEGLSTREIADRLDVSVKTIETHRRNTMKKLDLGSVAELTKYALKEGLTSLEN